MFKRKYKFILVTQGKPSDPNSRLLSVVATKKQAEEFIIRRLCAEHDTHYYPWARCHNLHPDLLETQVAYIKTVLTPADVQNFHVAVGIFTKTQLASLLRLAYTCPPIGASYEFAEEHSEFIKKYKLCEYLEQTIPPEDLSKLNAISTSLHATPDNSDISDIFEL